MRKAWSVIHLAFVALLILLGVFAVFAAWTAVATAHGSKRDFWDVATAIGTCGAVGVALWFGLRQESLRRGEALLRARLIAAHLGPQISVALDMIKLMRAAIAFALPEISEVNLYLRLRNHCNFVDWQVSPEELAALTPLPQQTAFRLAKGAALLKMVVGDIEKSDRFFGATEDVQAQHQLLTHWDYQLSDAERLFHLAFVQCHLAAVDLVREPSREAAERD